MRRVSRRKSCSISTAFKRGAFALRFPERFRSARQLRHRGIRGHRDAHPDPAQFRGDVVERREIRVAEEGQHPRIAEEGFPGLPVKLLNLGQILDDGPKLHPKASDLPGRRFERAHVAKDRKLLEHNKHRRFALSRGFALERDKRLRDQHAQPVGVGRHAHRRQANIKRHVFALEIAQTKIALLINGAQRHAVEKLRLRSRRRQDRPKLPFGSLVKLLKSFGLAKDHATHGVARRGQKTKQRLLLGHACIGRGALYIRMTQHEEIAHCPQMGGFGIAAVNEVKDQRLDQALGAVGPMRIMLIGLDKGVGKQRRVVDHARQLRVEFRQGIEGIGRVAPVLAERIEHVALLPFLLAGAPRDPREFALGIDRQHRALIEKQVRDHQRDALAGAGARHRHDMAVILPAHAIAVPEAKKKPGAVISELAGQLIRVRPGRSGHPVGPPFLAAGQGIPERAFEIQSLRVPLNRIE